jgi:putative spermidine/putrescine transport system permease protein
MTPAPMRRPRSSGVRLAVRIHAGLVFFFLLAPILIVIPLSFTSGPYLQFPPPGWSLRWYRSFLDDPVWVQSALRSLQIGVSTAILATALGSMLAFSLVRGRYRGRAALTHLAAAPLVVPGIVYSVAVYGLFSQFRLIGDWRGIVIGHTVLALPYVVIIITAGLSRFDPTLEQAALGLGASRARTIRSITLPLIRPALVSAIFLAFIASFDELVVAMFLGGSNMTLPKKMFDNIQNAVDPVLAVVSVLQIGLVSLALLIVARFGAGARPM